MQERRGLKPKLYAENLWLRPHLLSHEAEGCVTRGGLRTGAETAAVIQEGFVDISQVNNARLGDYPQLW